ncbi:17474_t:CDS:2 [Funneliformis geosporum]|uniref:17474_t:CDS:1 n=1 Tax=Funneliformis geosporum TaxID=1117311 RepID=A0A9W4WL63_9GLOM|nr:17474_t:CDS:2 [Funneliformis geosporum]
MSDDKGLLECLSIYSFLFLNKKGSNDISEVYGLFKIYECINSQKSLRVVIDIDTLQKVMETAGVKTQEPQKVKAFRLASNKEIVLTELWNWAKHTSSLPFENKTKLRIKKYHSKSDSVEKAHDFSNVEES